MKKEFEMSERWPTGKSSEICQKYGLISLDTECKI